MRTVGKALGGGRRRASREPLPMAAMVSKVERRQVAVLVDFSTTGARLRGTALPPQGEKVEVDIDTVKARGTVAWADQGLCGVAFDAPLPRFEVERLKRELASIATIAFSGESGLSVSSS
jgi:hypothetical protein